jgi:hypothetical protein
VKNHGLYTQCTKKVKSEYCKVCEDKPYGTILDRLSVDLYEYKDPKGKSPKRYTEVLKKLKISKETIEEEAKRLNITIAPIHLEEVVEQVKRGRPKSEKKVKEATGKKGRPKKEKKQVEVNNEEEEDLFATLIANANANQALEKVDPKEEANEEANEESKVLVAPVAVEKVEKKSKKVKETDPAKEAEKQKKSEEKAAKVAAKEIEKQKKAEEKAAKESEKQKKAEEKAAKEAAKQKKAEKKSAKALVPPLVKVEEEADVVRKFEHQGKSYYKSKNTGVIYNMEQEVVGKWNEERNDIDFEEEEEEEEYDD